MIKNNIVFGVKIINLKTMKAIYFLIIALSVTLVGFSFLLTVNNVRHRIITYGNEYEKRNREV